MNAEGAGGAVTDGECKNGLCSLFKVMNSVRGKYLCYKGKPHYFRVQLK